MSRDGGGRGNIVGARPPGCAVSWGREGTVLIEVMVAIVLAGVLIGPLAGGVISALGRADLVRREAARIADAAPAEGTSEAWSWGTGLGVVWWLPGPTLYAQAGRSADRFPTLGLWVDGWFMGEEDVDNHGVLCLEAGTWLHHEGAELVVRARTAAGVWGPPWRSLVPGVSGVVSLPSETGVPGGGATDPVGQVVVHAPVAGNPVLQPSWERLPATPTPLGMPWVVQALATGPIGVSLDALSTQSWRTEADRDLDVYF